MYTFEGINNENTIRTLIKRNLNKEYHSTTKCSVDFIYAILNEAYTSGESYDVSDMYNEVFAFATSSKYHSDYCTRLVNEMKFKS